MAVDCIRLLRDYPCRFSFGAKEPQNTEEEPEKNETTETIETTTNDAVLDEASYDILDIGAGTKFGLGASAVCLGSSAMSVNTHNKIQRCLRNFFEQVSKFIK